MVYTDLSINPSASGDWAEAILYNVMDLHWFMWNYANMLIIPLAFLITYNLNRLFYLYVKNSAIQTDLIGWLYQYNDNN